MCTITKKVDNPWFRPAYRWAAAEVAPRFGISKHLRPGVDALRQTYPVHMPRLRGSKVHRLYA